MAGKQSTSFDQTANPKLADAFCRGRKAKQEGQDITDVPFDSGHDAECTISWKDGFSDSRPASQTSCAQ